MISFLQPLFLWLLPAIGLPVLLNLVRRRIRLRIDFPSLQLLRSLEESRARRRPRWQDIILVCLRAAAIGMVILAAAGPRWSRPGSSVPKAIFVVIDKSQTMDYEESGGSRAARARDAARGYGALLGNEDLVAAAPPAAGEKVTWSSAERIVFPADSSAAVGGIADAVALGADAFRDPAMAGRKAEVVIFSDMSADSFRGMGQVKSYLPSSTEIKIIDVREKAGPFWNAAIAAVRTRPLPDGSYTLAVDIRQDGRPRPLRLEALTEGAGTFEIDMSSAPLATGRLTAPGGRISLECAGGYPWDDRCEIILPRDGRVGYSVLPGTPGDAFWRSALGAAGCEGAPAPTSGAAVVVAPATSWETDAFVGAAVADGALGVLIPTGIEPWAAAGFKTAAFRRESGSVGFGSDTPAAAGAGRFDVAGYAPLIGGVAGIVASTAGGDGYVIRRRWGRGEVWAFLSPLEAEFTSLYHTPVFPALAFDMRARALALKAPGYRSAIEYRDSGNTTALSAADVGAILPGALVLDYRHMNPGGSSGRSLAAFVVSIALLLLAAEAIVAAPKISSQ